MVAFVYRMGAGFPGDVNRSHPASIIAQLIDSVSPPTAYGQGVLVDTTADAGIGGVRPAAAADHSDTVPVAIRGVTVRPFPAQQAQTNQNYGSAAFGSVAPPTSGTIDVLDWGYIMVQIPVGQTPQNNSPIYIWAAATTTGHTLGGFESVYSSTNTVLVSNALFAGVPDANGNVEIRVIN